MPAMTIRQTATASWEISTLIWNSREPGFPHDFATNLPRDLGQVKRRLFQNAGWRLDGLQGHFPAVGFMTRLLYQNRMKKISLYLSWKWLPDYQTKIWTWWGSRGVWPHPNTLQKVFSTLMPPCLTLHHYWCIFMCVFPLHPFSVHTGY